MTSLKRRSFIKTGLLAAGSVVFYKNLSAKTSQVDSKFSMQIAAPGEVPDIVTIAGDNPVINIPKLLEPLGGIAKFVSPGQSVGLLANSPWRYPGFFTNPDIVLVVADLCMKAGASRLVLFKEEKSNYFAKGELYEDFTEVAGAFSFGSDLTEVDIPNGVYLKKAEVYKEIKDVDVFISLPVAKHHAGTVFSGNLKGMMGLSSSDTNRHMHSPTGEYTYEETEYLSQCIADLNLIRKPDLCIIDAIECATANGPAGPGPTVKPGKIIAGTDPLATDVFAAGLIGFEADEILTFSKAHLHKIGKADLSDLKLLEI